jgi:UTP:GlnB (protein PII) uridylyltransferase
VLVRNGIESSVANTTQIFIYAPFDITAFSRTCSRLEKLDLSVHDARIYHGSDGMSLDTYYVLDPAARLSRTRNGCAISALPRRNLGSDSERPRDRAASDTATRTLFPCGTQKQHERRR